MNSQVSRWFCRTNDPLICPCPVLNVVVPQKCFKGLPLKFRFRPFGDIRSNRKWNLRRAVNRKYSFSSGIEGLKVWEMNWASQISLVTWHFLAIHTLGCREPAWILRDQLFWNLTIKWVGGDACVTRNIWVLLVYNCVSSFKKMIGLNINSY